MPTGRCRGSEVDGCTRLCRDSVETDIIPVERPQRMSYD